MNIFVTDKCPIISAKALDDKRVIKMILESAQMLSTAMRVVGAPNAPYRVTHKNHPCSIWARTTKSNYKWLLDHFVALLSEYSARYGKLHACSLKYNVLVSGIDLIPEGDLTPFANCTPHKDIETIEAYRITMEEKWAVDVRKPSWKSGQRPQWF